MLTANDLADRLEEDPAVVAFISGFAHRHYPGHAQVIVLLHVTDLPTRIAAQRDDDPTAPPPAFVPVGFPVRTAAHPPADTPLADLQQRVRGWIDDRWPGLPHAALVVNRGDTPGSFDAILPVRVGARRDGEARGDESRGRGRRADFRGVTEEWTARHRTPG